MIQIDVDIAGFQAALNGVLDKMSRMVQQRYRLNATNATAFLKGRGYTSRTGRLSRGFRNDVQTIGRLGAVITLSNHVPYATYVDEGTRPHVIMARKAKALFVPGRGFFKSVKHPGTKGAHFSGDVVVAFKNRIPRDVQTAVDEASK